MLQYADVVASIATSPTSATRTMLRDIQSGAAPLYEVNVGRSVIAVIGIDRYADWPRLDNAVSDARAASRLFTHLGFVELTPPLLDEAATGEAMRRLVTDDLAQLSPEDSLVLFFAGHGHTHTARFGDMSVKTGCVIPVDGPRPRGHVASSWLRLDAWLSDIARLPPRHILVIVDACHSGVSLGALHKWREEGPEPTTALAALHARRSRRIITSALDDQRAMDGGPYPGRSLFTGCLIEALSGGLAEGGHRVATGRELGQYVQRRVRSYPPSTQTPDFGTFELDDRGDIIVPLALDESRSGCATPTTLGTGSGRISTWSRRPWSQPTVWLAAIALAIGIVLIGTRHDDADRASVASNNAGDAGSSASPTFAVAPIEPAAGAAIGAPDAAVRDASLPADAEPTIVTVPKTADAAIPGSAPASIPFAPGSPMIGASPTRSRNRSHRPSTPMEKPTASALAITPPPAAPEEASQGSATPAAIHSTPESVPPAGKCSKAGFAAVYEASAPQAGAVRAALRDLNACRGTGAISEADFERYQTAIVSKL